MKNKQIFLIFFLVVTIWSCNKESDGPKIKYLQIYTTYMIPFKYGQASESSKFIWESKTFNPDSTVKHWDYRANYDFDPMTNYLWSEENTYENGILKEKIETTTSTKKNTYNYSNNQLVNISVYNENGLIEKYDYKYSNSDNKADTLHYYWMYFDKPTTHVYSYDSNGNMIKDSINYYSIPYGVLTCEYDSHNNMTKETYYSSENRKTTIQVIRNFVYGSGGKISQYIFSSWYMIYFQKYIYQYLDNGLISQISVYESTTGIDGNYEQKGILKYEYNYAEK